MTLPDPHNPAQAAAVPAPRVYGSMAEAVAAAPAWPSLTRSQERLMQVVWARSLLFGKCYTGQVGLGEALGRFFPGGRAVSDRQIRNIVTQLERAHWITRDRTRGEVDLIKVRLPREGPRSASVLGTSKPRKSSSRDPGNAFPPKKRNTKYSELGGSPKGVAEAHPNLAPLFAPIDLRKEQFAMGAASLCEAVQRLFQKGQIARVRYPARRWPRRLLDAQLSQCGSMQTVRLITPAAGEGAYTVDFSEDSLLRLEFFRC